MAPTVVNIDELCPWDLQLRLNGVLIRTRCPTWADVVYLETMADGKAEDREQGLRDVLRRFVPAEQHGELDRAGWDALSAAHSACLAYLQDYGAKKKSLARDAAAPRPATAPPPQAARPGKASSSSPGLSPAKQ